jgi:phosphoglycolate phosphatase-like HAD superfamily hydrolase
MIGDSEVDVEAGRNAGCKTARLLESDVVEDKADVVASSLHEVIDQILRLEKDAGLVVAGRSF